MSKNKPLCHMKKKVITKKASEMKSYYLSIYFIFIERYLELCIITSIEIIDISFNIFNSLYKIRLLKIALITIL